jgi:hypothetical protein
MFIFSATGESPPRQPYKFGQDIFYFHHQFDMGLPHDSLVAYVLVVMMDDGRIVFGISSYNYTCNLSLEEDYCMLSIYNINGSYEDCIPLQNESHSMTAIDNSTVAVTSYNTIDMYDINNKVKIKSIVLPGIIFDLHQSGWGNITTTNNNLAVSVHNGIMIIDHQTMEVVKTIDTDGTSLWCLHGTNDKIFYCDYPYNNNNNNIYCYNYSDDQVEIETLSSQPWSITSLQDGSMYVACLNGSVQHVSSDCTMHKTVTTKELAPMQKHMHVVISYNPKQRKLVTYNLKGWLQVFNEV